VEKEAARRCARVDGVGEAFELNSLYMQVGYKINQILYAAAKPVQLPNDKSIPLAETLHNLCQSGPFGAAAADLVVEDLLTARFGQGFYLKAEVLILR
jgi:hypothetical protein